MSTFDRPLTGFRFVEIYHGDTLQRIAARELGDAARWASIAHLNGLVPPYIAETAAPGVLRYGDMLRVPAAAEMASAITDPDRVFGTDCVLRGRRLQVEAGDFATVAGRANFRQAITHRLVTREGELIYHPDYRCLAWRLVGAANGPTAGQLAAQYVRSALQRDERVHEVTRVEAQVQGDTIRVAAEVVPIAGRPMNIEV